MKKRSLFFLPPLEPINEGLRSPGRFSRAPLPQLSSLADAPPLSSSGKSTPFGRDDTASPPRRKLDIGRFENRRGNQLAPVKLNSLKMTVPQKPGPVASFMPKGTKRLTKAKKVNEPPKIVEEYHFKGPNKIVEPIDNLNDSENSVASHYSYEESDYDENDHEHSDSHLSPSGSSEGSPEPTDINALLHMDRKQTNKLDVPKKLSQPPNSSMQGIFSPLNRRKIDQPSTLKPLQKVKTTKKEVKSSKGVKGDIGHFQSDDSFMGENITSTNEEQQIVIQKEWKTMCDKEEENMKIKYQELVDAKTQELKVLEMDLRKENEKKIVKIRAELLEEIENEKLASQKELQNAKSLNQEKLKEEEEKFKKECENLKQSLQAEKIKTENEVNADIKNKKEKLEKQLNEDLQNVQKAHEINLKHIKEAHETEIKNAQKQHEEKSKQLQTSNLKDTKEEEDLASIKMQSDLKSLRELISEEEKRHADIKGKLSKAISDNKTVSDELKELNKKITEERELLKNLEKNKNSIQAECEELQDETEKIETNLDLLRNEKTAFFTELNILKENIKNAKSDLNEVKKACVLSENKSTKQLSNKEINTAISIFHMVCQSSQTAIINCKETSSQIEEKLVPSKDSACQTIQLNGDNTDQQDVNFSVETESIGRNARQGHMSRNISKLDSFVDHELENGLSELKSHLDDRIKPLEQQIRFLQEKLDSSVTPIPMEKAFNDDTNPQVSIQSAKKFIREDKNCDLNHVTHPKIPFSNTPSTFDHNFACKCEFGDIESCKIMQEVKSSIFSLNQILNRSFVPSLVSRTMLQGFGNSLAKYGNPVDNYYIQFRELQKRQRTTDLKHVCSNEIEKRTIPITSYLSSSRPDSISLERRSDLVESAENSALTSNQPFSYGNLLSYNTPEDPIARARDLVLREQAKTWKQKQQITNSFLEENILTKEHPSAISEQIRSQATQSSNLSASFNTLPSSFSIIEHDSSSDYNFWMARLSALQQRVRSHKLL